VSFKKIMPVLRVADLSKAIDWYTQQLGFELYWRANDGGDGENCMLQAGETSPMLSTRIKDQVEIVWPLATMEYGAIEFGIHDTDGYTLAFAEQAEP
jgi:catechol 2,3-dioxygenase-like lactoylglutathione lyase family enzyme